MEEEWIWERGVVGGTERAGGRGNWCWDVIEERRINTVFSLDGKSIH